MKKPKRKSINRRNFVKLLPAAGAAGLAVTQMPLKALAQTPSPSPTPMPLPSASPSPTPPLRVTKDMMRAAEQLMGLEFTDAQEAMAQRGVNNNLDSYEVVRKIDVPLDTEPAVVFHPALPGFHVKRASARLGFRFGVVRAGRFKSVEDLAFATVPELAELIRTKKVSSVE